MSVNDQKKPAADGADLAQIEDPSGTLVNVAPANTAATAAEDAEVVAFSPNTPLPAGTNIIGGTLIGPQGSSYQPDPSTVYSGDVQAEVDPVGRLETHGSVTSDEGSFRDDFSGTSLTTTLTGTLSFTNGSAIVNGTGTVFTQQVTQQKFIKKSTDSETLYLQVSYVVSDTQLVLSANYAGTTASGVTGVVSKWQTFTGTGGSFAVANSIVTIASGTTSGADTYLEAAGDYLPYTLRFYAAITQRIANQTAVLGFSQAIAGGIQATVQFSGTNNTLVNFVTASSAAATDTQTTQCSLPAGAISSNYNLYQIDLSANQATLSINGVVVGINTIHLPGPYDVLNIVQGWLNTGAPASTSSLTTDYAYFSNWDRLQIDNDFNGEPINTRINDQEGFSALSAAATAAAATTNGAGAVIFSVTGTWVGTIVPQIQASDFTWQTVDALDLTTGTIGQNFTSNGLIVIPCGGASQARVLMNAYTSGQANISFNAGAGTNFHPVRAIPVDGGKVTYSASITGLVAAATPTDIFTIAGSATRTIRVTQVRISGTQTTGAVITANLIKRSAANTGGISTAQTAVPYDSNSPAATATVLAYTANPTALGASVGQVRSAKLFVNTASTLGTEFIEEFGKRPAQAVVLRGTTQLLAINLGGTTVAGSLFDIDIEWTEE